MAEERPTSRRFLHGCSVRYSFWGLVGLFVRVQGNVPKDISPGQEKKQAVQEGGGEPTGLHRAPLGSEGRLAGG